MSDLPKTIWVVEQGDYSNYRVAGVFSCEESAIRIRDLINTNDYFEKAEIAEWPLDPCIKELNAGLSLWQITMTRNGTVHHCELEKYALEPCFDYHFTFLRGYVWAKDSQHAIKIVNEKRTQMIANNEWPEDVE